MSHVILELICLYFTQDEDKTVPTFCRYSPGKEGFHCVHGDGVDKCKFLGFSPAAHEIAYSGGDGEVDRDDWVAFGGDMELPGRDVGELLELWKATCKAKIDQAYDQYLEEARGDSSKESSS
jgi:hypothetical protein